MNLVDITSWDRAECDTERALDFSNIDNRVLACTMYGGRLFIEHYKRISAWDLTDPTAIRCVAEPPINPPGNRAKLIGHEWVFFGDKGVGSVDLERLELRQQWQVELGSQRIGARVGKDFWVSWDGGVGVLADDGALDKRVDLPDFDSYPTDLLSHDEMLYVVGRHSGFHVIDTRGDGTLLRSIGGSYPNTDLFWYKPGEQLIGVGNESLIQYDVRKPAKTKRLKNARFAGFELAGSVVLEDDAALVIGEKNYKSLVIGTVSLSDGPPVVANKQVFKKVDLPYPQPHDLNVTALRAVYRVGDYLLVVMMEALVVFKAT